MRCLIPAISYLCQAFRSTVSLSVLRMKEIIIFQIQQESFFFFKEDHFNHFFLTVHFFQEFFLNSQNWSWILFSSEFPTNKNHLLLFPGQCSHFFLMCNCSGILIIQAFVGFYNSLLVSRFLISLTVPEYQQVHS